MPQFVNNRWLEMVHATARTFLPILVWGAVALELVPIAIGLVFLAKWRVFFVKLRYWGMNLRTNAADLLVGLSFVHFFANAPNLEGTFVWLGLYLAWNFFSLTNRIWLILLQGLACQVLVTTAIWQQWTDTWQLVALFLAAYFVVRHILGAVAVSGRQANQLALIWGLFSAQLAWVLSHWQIYFWGLPQLALIQLVSLLPLCSIYIQEQRERLKTWYWQQTLVAWGFAIVFILVFSNWQAQPL